MQAEIFTCCWQNEGWRGTSFSIWGIWHLFTVLTSIGVKHGHHYSAPAPFLLWKGEIRTNDKNLREDVEKESVLMSDEITLFSGEYVRRGGGKVFLHYANFSRFYKFLASRRRGKAEKRKLHLSTENNSIFFSWHVNMHQFVTIAPFLVPVYWWQFVTALPYANCHMIYLKSYRICFQQKRPSQMLW